MIHQIYPVKDNKIVIQLPRNLTISQAEVIVLPVIETETSSSEDEVTAVLADFLNMDVSHFSPVEKQAYLRISQVLQQQKAENAPRVAGLFTGLVHVTDDFGAPLEDEDLFWGVDTNAYGIKEQ